MTHKHDIQAQFVENLKMVCPSNVSLAEELAELLALSSDSVYRRLRCETEFSLSETVKICEYFSVKLPFQTVENQFLPFTPSVYSNDKKGFEEYLLLLRNGIMEASTVAGAKLVYAGEDLPVFYSFTFPHLRDFKIKYWCKSIMDISPWNQAQVEDIELPEQWVHVSNEIAVLFSKMPTVEIWNYDSLKSTFEQLKFYWDSGFFIHKETVHKVINDLFELLSYLEDMAHSGQKIHPVSKTQMAAFWQLYSSDLMIGNNTVLVTSDQNKMAYVGYNSFNFISTAKNSFVEQIEHWLENLLSKSTLISKVGEKHRRQFFSSLKAQLVALKSYIDR